MMEKIYQYILSELTSDSSNPKPAVSVADVIAAAARMDIVHEDLYPLLRYLLENSCTVDTPANPEEEQLLRVAKLSRYDILLENSIHLFFSRLNPSDESCIGAIESITKHLARLRRHLRNPSSIQVLRMKVEGICAEEIAEKLKMTMEELYCTEKRVYETICKTRPQHHAHHGKYIKFFYTADTYEEILKEVQTCSKEERTVLSYEQVITMAVERGISEDLLPELVDYLVMRGCIILAPDGELRIIPQRYRIRKFRTESSQVHHYTSYGEWIIRTMIVISWFDADTKDKKDRLHKARFMKHLKRDVLLISVYSMRKQQLSTLQIAKELERDPEEIMATDARIWDLYKASFPV